MTSDWSPGAYGRFRGLRLRPALDLLAQVPDLPAGDVVDLGCGDGAAAGALGARFSGRRLVGVDASPAMLAAAGQGGCYAALEQADILRWRPATPPALIFSNAALQWVEGHPALLPHLAGLLAAGGTLAVQMPRQQDAPSHVLLRQVAVELFPDRFDGAARTPVAPPQDYHRRLAPFGAVSAWETTYLQRLAPAAAGHPVRHFTESTTMRPYLDALSPPEAARFVADYEAALATAYPAEPDGSVLFPFTRVFFVLTLA